MALERAVVGALSPAELVDRVVRQSALIDRLQGALAEQQALIARLEARVRELERELGQRDRDDPSTKMPGLKPAATPRRRKGGPRQRRAHGFGRPWAEPSERVLHAGEACPRCSTPLAGGRAARAWRKQVLELAPSPVRVIEHVYLRRRCPNPSCRAEVAPPPVGAAELGVVGARQRLGAGLVSLVAAWRAELRLPLALIQWYLGAVHHLELSVGALQRVAARGTAAVAAIRAAIRASLVVNADEACASRRQDGASGYLWSFSTPRERYFVRGKRDKAVVETALGPAFVGVLVTDFYAAYDHYLGPHQRCWSPLLRDIRAVLERHPADAALAEWATQVRGVYERARRFASPDVAARERAQHRFEAELLTLCTPYLQGDTPAVPQAVLCRRIQKYLPELFTFVADPAVPSTNNAAERSVRPVVIQRKISGGTRSAQGTSTCTALATLFGTWRARGLDPLVACRQLLLDQAPALQA